MHTQHVRTSIGIRMLLLATVLLGLHATGGTAYAVSDYLTTFNATYGTSGTVLNTCTLCHIGVPSPRNAYGSAFAANGHSFAAIEGLDSDGDGFTNIVEINARTFPGDAASFPATGPTITTTSPLPAGTVGMAYNQTLVATGGTPPYTWAVTAGNLPAGLTLAPATGVISGTPTTAGMFNFTVQVTDGGTGTMAFSLTINAAPDVTPPTVSFVAPDNSATGVAVGTSVVATFSEPILTSSVTASTFILSDGIDNVVGTFSVNGAIVTFDPTTPLADNTAYMATLTTGITDLAGNALAANFVWSFTTAAAGAPAPAAGGGDSGGCAVARSGGGIREAAGAYGFLLLTVLGMALRRRAKRRGE